MTSTTNGMPTEAERKKLIRQAVTGSPFDTGDRLFSDFGDGQVFAYPDFTAQDIKAALRRDGKVRSQYEVLTLPIRSAAWKIDDADGDTGQADLCRAAFGDQLSTVIDQTTTAVAYVRAFFELDWALHDTQTVNGRPAVWPRQILMRPATSCEAGFDANTGVQRGFRQRLAPVPGAPLRLDDERRMPGYRHIRGERAFVYTHNRYADPVRGSGELDVALWCSSTKKKIEFLWFQFLENQSLPKILVYEDDQTRADETAETIAGLRASGVMGKARTGEPTAKQFDILESSGAGAGQFQAAAAYLDTMMVSASLAGFTELASAAASGRGSYALSADQSDFFLASRQAVADEIAEQIREGLFAPLVHHNWGPRAPVPKLTIGPLSNRNTDRALDLLKSIVSATQLNVPRELVDMLALGTAKYLGMDPDKVEQAIQVEIGRREQADDLKRKQQEQMLQNPVAAAAARAPGTLGDKPQQRGGAAQSRPGQQRPPQPTRPGSPPKQAVQLARAVDIAEQLVRRARDGETPEAVLDEIAPSAATHIDLAAWDETRHPRVPRGMPGGGQFVNSRTPDLMGEIRRTGGFTYDPAARRLLRVGDGSVVGFAVAVPHTERLLGGADMSPEQFNEAIVSVVREDPEAFRRGDKIGGWYSADRDQFMVERSQIHDVSLAEAVALGQDRNQEAILDMATGEFIDTGGSGG